MEAAYYVSCLWFGFPASVPWVFDLMYTTMEVHGIKQPTDGFGGGTFADAAFG